MKEKLALTRKKIFCSFILFIFCCSFCLGVLLLFTVYIGSFIGA